VVVGGVGLRLWWNVQMVSIIFFTNFKIELFTQEEGGWCVSCFRPYMIEFEIQELFSKNFKFPKFGTSQDFWET
jgi:hypothetical protein